VSSESDPGRGGPAPAAADSAEAELPVVLPRDDVPPLRAPAVLVAVFVIATCGLIYELIAGTLASYVLGDSVTQFSTVIGVYLSAMGLGAWLSKAIDRNVAARFVEIEVMVALIGGGSAPLLFLAFSHLEAFRVVLYGMVLVIGSLVGLEIPLLMRILQDRYDLKDLVARVLTFDYLGALLASLAFPMFVVPKLGLVRGSLAVGLLNAGVALWSTFLFGPLLGRGMRRTILQVEAALTIVLLTLGLAFSDHFTSLAEDQLYPDEIVFARTTPYQRIVVTKAKSSFQLYLSGNLQFASADEHRYHEALVHPPMAVARSLGGRVERALVLGGGDGLAVRELLRHPDVREITLVDLDAAMTELARELPLLAAQNKGSLLDPRVTVVNADAMRWLMERPADAAPWDVILVDFPDPNNFSLGKLYTTRFYALARRALAPGGALVVQATSPLLARRSFWCVVRTMEASGFVTRPYHATVPSFGEWGYVLAAREPFEIPRELPEGGLAFLTPEVMAAMFAFPADMAPIPADVNRLNNQILVQYYDSEWSAWF
jgi:spermidine synthase